MVNWKDCKEEMREYRRYKKEGLTTPEINRLFESEERFFKRETRCRTVKGTMCEENCKECERVPSGLPQSLEQLIEAGMSFPEASSVEVVVEKSVLYAGIHKLMDALPELERQILFGIFWLGYGERELAEQLNIPQSTLNDRKRKILIRIRKDMQNLI